MTYFAWNPSLETGYADVDEQHKGLFALANQLQQAIDTASGDRDAVENAVYGLIEYCVEHFADEEELMRRVDYPELAAHSALHKELTAETMKLTASYFNNEDVAPDTLASFMAAWLLNHILEQDMQFAAFMRAQEPTA